MIFTTQAQAEECLRWWQKTLRLQDWDIKVEIRRGYDMGNMCGNANIRIKNNTADICLLDWNDLTDKQKLDDYFNQEATLVHELLHIIMDPFSGNIEADSLKHKLMEQAINRLSAALIKIRYAEA